MTTLRRDIQPALDHLEAALEASCVTLITLASMRDHTIDARPIHGQITRAVESLRAAIAELRAVHECDTSVLAFGFVLAAPSDWPRRVETGAPQVKPRRTA